MTAKHGLLSASDPGVDLDQKGLDDDDFILVKDTKRKKNLFGFVADFESSDGDNAALEKELNEKHAGIDGKSL